MCGSERVSESTRQEVALFFFFASQTDHQISSDQGKDSPRGTIHSRKLGQHSSYCSPESPDSWGLKRAAVVVVVVVVAVAVPPLVARSLLREWRRASAAARCFPSLTSLLLTGWMERDKRQVSLGRLSHETEREREIVLMSGRNGALRACFCLSCQARK